LVEDLKRIEAGAVGDIWVNSEAYENLLVLCDEYGSRFAGTKGEKPAVNYMVRKLREYGLEKVDADPFTYVGWKRSPAKLELLELVKRELQAISLPLCPPSDIEGEVIDLGNGEPSEFKRREKEIAGKIVMCTSAPGAGGREVHRRTKYGYGVAFGAKGFIFGNHNPGQLLVTGSLRPAYRMAGEIPAVGVSWETVSFVLRQMKKGRVKARIKATDRVILDSTSWNAVGEVHGSDLKDRFIVIGGHFDGHDISQGAMDDASGACVVMEVARALAKFSGRFKRSLRFICFAAEEMGVTGSTAYVAKHLDEMGKVDLMINCDGAGRANRHTFRVSGPSELVKSLGAIAKEIGYPMDVGSSVSTASDHWPFYMQQVPSVSYASAPDPMVASIVAAQGRGFGHTSADTVDKVDHRGLKEAAMVLAQFVIRLANMDEISRRMSLKETVEYLEQRGVAEELRIQKKWHPEKAR